ncbi:MAG: hypothetical protein LBT35_05550 [Tannerella sp.]|jgi:hypothetical protein|nr:hypothetical protein [Tannerella sp.]
MKEIYLLLTGICLMFMSSHEASAADVPNAKKLIGKWEVSIPDAPYDYRSFVVDIKTKNGEYLADIKSANVDLKDRKLTEKNGKLSGVIYIDGESVTVTIWEEKNIVKGTASTTQGVLDCSFKKPTPPKAKK